MINPSLSKNPERDSAIFEEAMLGAKVYELRSKYHLGSSRICEIVHNQAAVRGFTLYTWSVAWIKSWWDTEGREAFNRSETEK